MSGIRVIVNPASSRGRTGRRLATLESQLRAALGPLEILLTEHPGHATELARGALRDGADRIVAVGGDGTVSEVVNGFFAEGSPVNSDAVLGVVTSGTGGDFRRSHPIPGTLGQQLQVLASDHTHRIDIGQVRFLDHAGSPTERHFANSASAGLSGTVCKAVNRARISKLLGGRMAFRLASLRGLLGYRNQRVRLCLDDGEAELRTVNTVAVCNGRYFGGGMAIAPKARCDDGLLDVIVLGDFALWDAVRSMPMIYRGTHPLHPKVRVARVARIRLEPAGYDPVLIEVDGEGPGRLPATFSVMPAALRLLVRERPGGP